MIQLLHLADLHLGKSLYGQSRLEEQKEALEQIIQYVSNHEIDGILLAGDIFDTKRPSIAARKLYEDFVLQITEYCPLYAIAGNHDQGEGLQLFSSLFAKHQYYISGTLEYPWAHSQIKKGNDIVNIYLLPYYYYTQVKKKYSDTLSEIDWLRKEIQKLSLNPNEINLLVTHLFVDLYDTQDFSDLASGSEMITQVGTLEALPRELFSDFDYVALGHIHRPQWSIDQKIGYAGALLPYAFDEQMEKSFTLLTIDNYQISHEEIPIQYKKNLVTIAGTIEEIQQQASNVPNNDYVKLVIQEKNIVENAKERFQPLFPNLLTIEQEISQEWIEKERENKELPSLENNLFSYFSTFYQEKMGEELNSTQKSYLEEKLQSLDEEIL